MHTWLCTLFITNAIGHFNTFSQTPTILNSLGFSLHFFCRYHECVTLESPCFTRGWLLMEKKYHRKRDQTRGALNNSECRSRGRDEKRDTNERETHTRSTRWRCSAAAPSCRSTTHHGKRFDCKENKERQTHTTTKQISYDGNLQSTPHTHICLHTRHCASVK